MTRNQKHSIGSFVALLLGIGLSTLALMVLTKLVIGALVFLVGCGLIIYWIVEFVILLVEGEFQIFNEEFNNPVKNKLDEFLEWYNSDD